MNLTILMTLLTLNFSMIFKVENKVVVAVEILEVNDVLNCVPVIVNAVLQEHQLIVDIVAFVKEGMLAKSRLQEKQRHKVMTAFISGKL